MENKVYALKPSFVASLYEEWTSNYQGKSIRDFLIHINNKYSKELKKHIEPGDTGIYIDDEVLFFLNRPKPTTGSKSQWDLENSQTIFEGIQNGLGIYRKDEGNNKIPISVVQATDARIWNYLSLFGLHIYTIERWGESKDSRRIIVNSVTNANTSRHAILRLYWTAFLCFDDSRTSHLELLKTLWCTPDFMTQVTERSTANMKQQIQWFLEFCSDPDREKKIFKEKSIEGYFNYRKLIKLFLADSKVLSLPITSKVEIEAILEESLEAC